MMMMVMTILGVELKLLESDESEAKYEISIFAGASLRKAEIARVTGLSDTASALIEPTFVVINHGRYLYLVVYLYRDCAVHLLGHSSC
jgi:hypothetical protein